MRLGEGDLGHGRAPLRVERRVAAQLQGHGEVGRKPFF